MRYLIPLIPCLVTNPGQHNGRGEVWGYLHWAMAQIKCLKMSTDVPRCLKMSRAFQGIPNHCHHGVISTFQDCDVTPRHTTQNATMSSGSAVILPPICTQPLPHLGRLAVQFLKYETLLGKVHLHPMSIPSPSHVQHGKHTTQRLDWRGTPVNPAAFLPTEPIPHCHIGWKNEVRFRCSMM